MNEREQLAKDNGMIIEFVNWFFDNKKDGCGNAWFIMMAAMWEGWSGREAKCAALAAENAALKDYLAPIGLKVEGIPATDAFLAEVRAQGVEMAAKSDQFSTWVQQGLRSFAIGVRQGDDQ